MSLSYLKAGDPVIYERFENESINCTYMGQAVVRGSKIAVVVDNETNQPFYAPIRLIKLNHNLSRVL